LDERLLIKQCCRQNRKAQRYLFEQTYPLAFRLSRRYLVNVHDAEDVLSGVYVRVFQHIHRLEYRGEGSLQKWINTIVIHECIRFLSRSRPLFSDEDVSALALENEWESMLTAWDGEAVQQIIDNMPAGYRTVFNLYALEGYSHREIAEMLEITEGTSKSQLSKARNYLIDKLNKNNQYETA
jgi:RNA polymerase sigma-70 factor (ECF subfamily)